MIEALAAEPLTVAPVRFQIIGDAVDAARAMGYSDANLDALLRFLRDQGRHDDLNSFLDRPLIPKPQLGRQSRFSDGSFPVFYSALDTGTAQAEIIHLRSSLGQEAIGTAYYYLIRCSFNGMVKDLRNHVAQFPFLVLDQSTGAYEQCNVIGKEARDSGLDGLRTISARTPDGECLPVFRRPALSDPVRGNLFSFSVDAAGGPVRVTEHAAQ